MVLEIEDVVNVMTVLHPDPDDMAKHKYNLGVNLDHSSGHAKDKPDGLSALPSALNLGHIRTQK